MGARQALRWLGQWGPFGARTVAYGACSLALGPLTADRRASLWAMRRWSESSLTGLGIRVEPSGLEHVPAHGGFVYAANHQSQLDILVLGAALPGDFKWAAKRQLMHVPFLGWHLRLAGHVPVDRQSGPAAAARTTAAFERTLRQGKPLLVFPEGTRSADGELRPFKNGGFVAAVRAGAPIVPVVVDGTFDLMPKGAVDAASSRSTVRVVRVRLGPAVRAATGPDERARAEDLRDRTRGAMLALLGDLRGRRSAPARPLGSSGVPARASGASASDGE
ncbi:MAG: 1-acyl-sn-glycerol-3-phosphate acyltransferase [Myxococcales bacterium]|nr:1-acyl-sn-glycerol-3-phosphate acyltransferase [Myxococcales bacterium]